MASNGLLSSFLAAIQASLSVLLVISYGAIAAKFKLLDSASGKVISKVCVKMFLPALLFAKIGSELHAGSAHRYLIILIWAFICHFVSFLIGMGVHLGFGFPDWTTAALMFNNTTSYPLLLIQSLQETGILQRLIGENENMSAAIERAKSYFLVFATISSCLTFAVGPRLIDTEHSPDPPDDKDDEEDDDDGARDEEAQQDGTNEGTTLLPHTRERLASIVETTFFPTAPRDPDHPRQFSTAYDRRPSKILIAKKRWLELHPRTQWWLLFLYDFLNAPLLGAVVGAIIGLVPPLQRAFFNDTADGGIFTAWLTASLKNIGSIFVPLPLIVAGVSLLMSYRASRSAAASSEERTPWLVTGFVLVVRFIIWPAVSIPVIYALAKKTDVLGTDPMLWFTLMLMPTGPSAMKLITMVQVSDADEKEEHKIARLLTISYVISPILAFTVVGSLKAAEAAMN
ncbi:hypothetical protein NA57DRAFT_35813 [Rhizodiscina lignyota]|uniref:Auxin efflux carrier n=1 Tax=Rhizodiscina lignyota TaxID=1504668 RepID=A0A9P4IMT2_9PEZI|nr:hypothetical protein NA57DRAFT_35813 [Rhizodiscina lignyota]